MKKYFALLSVTIFLLSCKNEVKDNTRPVIETFSVIGAPIVGGSLTVSSLISDDQALGSYKVTLYDDFGFTADSIDETARLSHTGVYDFTEDLLTHLINEAISIPSNTSAGPYKISLEVLDKKGNQATKIIEETEIINSIDQPTISITFPANDTTFSGSDTLNIAGTLTDNVALGSIYFELSNSTGFYYTLNYDSVYSTSWDPAINGNAKIPFSSNTGSFDLLIEVTDTTGNMKRQTTSFTKN